MRLVSIVLLSAGLLVLAGRATAQTPTVTDVIPPQGTELGGTQILVRGTNLDTISLVRVGGIPASNVRSLGTTAAIANVPPGVPGGPLDVTVTTAGGTATLPGAFTYLACTSTAGCALSFDGANDWVQFPSLGGSLKNTYEAWLFLPSGCSVATFQRPITHRTSSGCTEGVLLNARTNGWVAYDLAPAGCGTSQAVGFSGAPLDSWIHVAGTFDGTVQSLYVNGVLVAQQNASPFPLGSILNFGAGFQGTQSFFCGMMDEVRIWNYSRSVQEIRDLMFRRATGAEMGLLGYWRLNECSGQTVADETSTGTDGTLGGSSSQQSSDPTWATSGIPMCDELSCGPLTPYGSGLAGLGGFTPTLSVNGCVATGQNLTIDIANGPGGAVGVVLLGLGAASVPALGGTLLVLPVIQIPVVLGGTFGMPGVGTTSVAVSIPANPLNKGLDFFWQGLFLDVGAPVGVSMTPGAQMRTW